MIAFVADFGVRDARKDGRAGAPVTRLGAAHR